MPVIVIEPRGDNLAAVTRPTRGAAEIAAIGGYVAQVWTWRNGEAVVVREWSPGGRSGYGCISERWCVLVRRGLRAGAVQHVPANSIASALAALGLRWRTKSCRARPCPPTTSMARRMPLVRAVHSRGNTWRTLR